MKLIKKEIGITIVILVTVMGFALHVSNINKGFQEDIAKLQNLQAIELDSKDKEIKDSNKLINELVIPSDIEIIAQAIMDAKVSAQNSLNTINSFKKSINEEEPNYERFLLISVCAERQMERNLEGSDYSIDFCYEDKNLELFRTKK